MSISKNRGQASLEMVVGLIILLVVAGVVIGLVFTTMNKDNMNSVSGGLSKQYIDKCNSYCETKDYGKYCSQTFKQATGSIDWNGDKNNARMFKDPSSVWAFCEDSVYCFLVTKCPEMTADGCRDYICQQYVEMYGNATAAGAKLREIYKVSENPQSNDCFLEEKQSGATVKTYFRDLAQSENWLYRFFVSKQWCTSQGGGVFGQLNCGDGVCDCLGGETVNNCPVDCHYNCGNGQCEAGECAQNCPQDCGGSVPQVAINLTNCTYNSSEDSITCDTSCIGTVTGKQTTFVVIDKNGNMSIAMAGGTTPTGTITIASGKVTGKMVDSSIGMKLSSLEQTTSQWMVSLSCQNPVGSGNTGLNGATKV